MKNCFHFLGVLVVSTVVDINALCPITRPHCPIGYELRNEWCHYVGTQPACPPGYELKGGLCYINSDCSIPEIITTPSPNNEVTTSLPGEAGEAERCPQDSIFMNEKCRKIICSLGEYYNGHCLQPACPPGLVWHHKRCQKPGYIITVLEIDNKLTNERRDHAFTITQNTTNYVTHNRTTATTTTTTTPTTTIKPTKSAPTTQTTTTSTTDRSHNGTNSVYENDTNCCTIVTPRICKIYGQKWVCFNRRLTRCDRRVCGAKTVYLRAPEIHFKHPVLIMPPNPPLKACIGENCQRNDIIDCSGCVISQHENCSSYCYHYICPEGACVYMKLEEYCNYYPGQFGCLEQDGCIWNWC